VYSVDTPAIVLKPEPYKVTLCRDNEEISIGHIDFAYAPAPALTEERVAAIRSNPFAAKWVRTSFRCNFCADAVQAYTGFERSHEAEQEGWTWYKALPDVFTCKCGITLIDLTMLRESLHVLIGNTTGEDEGPLSFTRLYNKSALESILSGFASLLDSNPPEETVQKFIKKNPILLQHFSPQRIFDKSPILALHKTDFSVLNSKGDLLLIEIERPGIPLMKKTGKRLPTFNTQ